MENVVPDIRVTLRASRRSPGFPLTALATLALGIQTRCSHPIVVNSASELVTEAVLGACEMTALLFVLRPWNYAHFWTRATIAFAVFAPWPLAAGMAGVQAGSVYATHTPWRLTLSAMLLVLAVLSGVAAVRSRGRSSAGCD